MQISIDIRNFSYWLLTHSNYVCHVVFLAVYFYDTFCRLRTCRFISSLNCSLKLHLKIVLCLMSNLSNYFLFSHFKLDDTVNKEWLGWVVAANPLGQLIFSPLVGWWCNKIESVRTPSLVCLILFIVSNVWYAVLPLHDKGAVWFICVARFLVGVSSGKNDGSILKSFCNKLNVFYSSFFVSFAPLPGSITACRTFITQGTLVSERTKAISHLSLSQALGFVLGPGKYEQSCQIVI